jgi:hypothetical protein
MEEDLWTEGVRRVRLHGLRHRSYERGAAPLLSRWPDQRSIRFTIE